MAKINIASLLSLLRNLYSTFRKECASWQGVFLAHLLVNKRCIKEVRNVKILVLDLQGWVKTVQKVALGHA